MQTAEIIFRVVSSAKPGTVRDNEVKGVTHAMPEVGERFVMLAPPRDEGNVRWINTSAVKTVEWNAEKDLVTFTTESGSIYSVEILPESDATT